MSNQNKQPTPKMEETRAPWLWQLQGYVKTVTTIPTYTPRTFDQSVKIYMNSLATPTTKRLYIYSFEAGIWNYIALT